jgi:hypothetical protein
MRLSKSIVTSCAVIVGLSAGVSFAQSTQPTVVVAVRGIDELLNDADFLGEELGKPGMKGSAEGTLEAITGGKGLTGFNREKPLGAYVTVNANGAPPMPVVFVPVDDAKAVEALITQFAPDFANEDGQWSMTVNGMKVFGKESGGYVYLSLDPSLLSKPADPAKIVRGDYDVLLDVNLAGIPEPLKEQFLEQAEQGGRQNLENQPPASNEAEAKGREFGFALTMAVMKAVMLEGDRFSYGVDVDSEGRTAKIDMNVTGRSGTPLAESFASLKKVDRPFASLTAPESPFSIAVSIPTKGILPQIEEFVRIVREEATAEIEKDESLDSDAERAAAKDAASQFADLILETARAGSVHAAMTLEDGEETTGAIAAVRLSDGKPVTRLIEQGLKDANLDTETVTVAGAKGYSIPVGDDEELTETFGEGPGHAVVKGNDLWWALGADHLKSLEKAMTGKSGSGKPSAPVSLRFKPATLVTMFEKNDEGLIERADAVAEKDGDMLHIEVAPIDAGARFRIEFGIDLLQLSGAGSGE